jgi:hypothetical protein
VRARANAKLSFVLRICQFFVGVHVGFVDFEFVKIPPRERGSTVQTMQFLRQ